jgi:hypothetical protein
MINVLENKVLEVSAVGLLKMTFAYHSTIYIFYFFFVLKFDYRAVILWFNDDDFYIVPLLANLLNMRITEER